MVMMHKMAHGVSYLSRYRLIKPPRAGSDPLKVRQRPANLELRSGFFSYCVVKGWNKIPASIKKFDSYRQFQRGIPENKGY
jgi:hypothetical protein